MEQECKIVGESLRNGHVLNKDRISELPEALLLKILSSVPTKEVIATSVLSKQWRSLWKMVPNLMFNSVRHKSKHQRFSEIVFRSLLSHKAPVLESLHLEVEDESEALDVYGLELHLHTMCVNWSWIFTLTKIEFDSFKSVRKLHLDYVIFDNEESVCNLFSGCPRLEDLFVQRTNIDVETFTVDVPSLLRLTIVDELSGEGHGRYVINAPCLKYLNIRGFELIKSCLIKAPEVVEAKIVEVSFIENDNILESLASVKRLSLHLSPCQEIKFPVGIIYHHLISLELFTLKGWNLLPLMLESCPKLQILKLTDPYHFDKEDCPVGWEWSQPKCVPECLLFQLETLVWRGYEWQREEEKVVAVYILNNARRLKKATIIAKPIKPAELVQLEKRREMLNQLASEVKVSNSSCHLVLECKPYRFNN